MFSEIDQLYARALGKATTLKRTPIRDYRTLLRQAGLPDRYRPTLYDFIAHQALGFYTSREQAGARPADGFCVAADGPIFGSVGGFLRWQPEPSDPEAPGLKAMRLYQDLLRFHRRDPEPSAFLDVDLARLAWGFEVAAGENKPRRYGDALKRFVGQWARHEISAMALDRLAGLSEAAGDRFEAHELAVRGLKAHRASPGGRLCANRIAQIECPWAEVKIERTWSLPGPQIHIRYRNVTRLKFEVRALPARSFLRPVAVTENPRYRRNRPRARAESPLLAWFHELPPTPDFGEHSATLEVPTPLKPGGYLLRVSHRPSRDGEEEELCTADFWVTKLALVVRTRAKRLEGFVLEANSGEPVPRAKVEACVLGPKQNPVVLPATRTDVQGFFAFARCPSPGDHRVLATKDGQQVSYRSDQPIWPPLRPLPSGKQTIFFTDRAIYRPGQTIQYKGICVHYAARRADYRVLVDRRVVVALLAGDRRELARQEHRSNGYGSFAGSFTAPHEGPMGVLELVVIGEPAGFQLLHVEEYKRPKFSVILEAPQLVPRVGDLVSVRGQALAYTGAGIDGAKVRWHVQRIVHFPPGQTWIQRPPLQLSDIHVAGTDMTTTQTDGSFRIEFVARPDPGISEADEPTYEFGICAEVNDSAGETQNAELVMKVGYSALEIRAHADQWLTAGADVALEIKTLSPSGEPQAASGALRVHRLREPGSVTRNGLGTTTAAGFERTESFPNESDPNTWELGESKIERAFTTPASGQILERFKLPAGAYCAVVSSPDRSGRTVTARHCLMVFDPEARSLAVKVPHYVAQREIPVEPGEEFVALWGTGYETGRACVEIEHHHRIVRRFWTRRGRTQDLVKVAVTEALRGGFILHVTQVRENRAYFTHRRVEVPWTNKQLHLEWEHFTSRLEPGQRETWSLVVRPPATVAHTKAAGWFAAEMVGVLYDASLDRFVEPE